MRNKQIIKKTICLIIICCLFFLSVVVGINASKNINFNIGLKFDPDFLCEIEVKNSNGEYVSIFNNYQPSAVNNDYIYKIENNTLQLSIPELENALGTTLTFRISNYTQTTGISVKFEIKDNTNNVLSSEQIYKISAYNPTTIPENQEKTITLTNGTYLCLEINEEIEVFSLTLTKTNNVGKFLAVIYLSNENNDFLEEVFSTETMAVSSMPSTYTLNYFFEKGKIYNLRFAGFVENVTFSYDIVNGHSGGTDYYGVVFTENATATFYGEGVPTPG